MTAAHDCLLSVDPVGTSTDTTGLLFADYVCRDCGTAFAVLLGRPTTPPAPLCGRATVKGPGGIAAHRGPETTPHPPREGDLRCR